MRSGKGENVCLEHTLAGATQSKFKAKHIDYIVVLFTHSLKKTVIQEQYSYTV